MSESESTQVVEEENRRLSGIQQLTEQEQQEEIKKREKNKAYQLHKEYDDYEQAKKDLEDFKLNGIRMKHHQFKCDKHYYKCPEKNCPVRMYLWLDQESSSCRLYVTNVQHNHEAKIGICLPEETMKEVQRLIKLSKFSKFIISLKIKITFIIMNRCSSS